MTASDVSSLASELRSELLGNILPYWEKYSRDPVNGGYWGTLRQDNTGDPAEPRSVVMTARHLWSYSAASAALGEPRWLESAKWAYDALTDRFLDREFGGVYWAVRPDGTPSVAKKQIYGEAFAMYGFSEYAQALLSGSTSGSAARSPDPTEPLRHALDLFCLLELHARDPASGGYVEARARDWTPTSDLKLSDKDIDCDKSMNTNLHVMEALTTLYRALGAFAAAGYATVPGTVAGTATVAELRARVAEALAALVNATMERILGADAHLDLYFDRDWNPVGDPVSYGHDIEASWLLWEAIEELADFAGPTLPAPGSGPTGRDVPGKGLAERWREGVVRIARVALAEGFDPETGALENETHGGHRDRTRIWWCQAEALVGFFNAWEMTGERPFLDAALAVWGWIDRFQSDRAGGDWHAAVGPDGAADLTEPKGGNWKTPYHNARSCMEIMRRARHIGERR